VSLVVAVSLLEFSYRPERSSYGRAVLDARPAGYWDLGELHVGPEAHNAVAGGRAGRFRGAIGFGTRGAIASSSDTAVQLDQREGAIVLGTPAPGAQASSVTFWLRPDSATAKDALDAAWRPPPLGMTALIPWIVARQTTRAFTWTMAFEVPNRLSVIYQERSASHAIRVVARVESGRFSFVAITVGRGGPQLSVDGRPATTRGRRIPPFPTGPLSPLTFGGEPGVGLKHFAGTVDDIAVFPRALSDNEVRHLWRVARSD
jgi:Concanavalin A-like lectin/glucanases superfamily